LRAGELSPLFTAIRPLTHSGIMIVRLVNAFGIKAADQNRDST
jgi:hypothetical protein